MQLINGYWTDKNNNRWNEFLYREEEAKSAARTLNNCRDCENCENCMDCRSCMNCSECVNCWNCADCMRCAECQGCWNCMRCEDCNGCENCRMLVSANRYKNQPQSYMTACMGSRNNITYMYYGDTKGRKSVQVVCGCFRGDLDEFEQKVQETHGDNEYGQAYMAEIEKVRQLFGLK